MDLSGVVCSRDDEVRVMTAGSEDFHAYFEGLRGKRRATIIVQAGDTWERIGKKYGLTSGATRAHQPPGAHREADPRGVDRRLCPPWDTRWHMAPRLKWPAPRRLRQRSRRIRRISPTCRTEARARARHPAGPASTGRGSVRRRSRLRRDRSASVASHRHGQEFFPPSLWQRAPRFGTLRPC